MSDIDVRNVVQEELSDIAPEVDFAAVNPAADLREAIDIDSMDFLNFITAVHHRLGVDIPEVDYPKLVTIDGVVAYIEARLATNMTESQITTESTGRSSSRSRII
jgi:acyl carrier protein